MLKNSSKGNVLSNSKGFTLIELLVVMGILAVLATATALIINPATMLAQGRDSKRLTDINLINEAFQLFHLRNQDFIAQENKLYISLPDSSPGCASYSLPTLGSGWSYVCVPEASYRNTDSTGWIPVDLSGFTPAKFDRLPVDPKNSKDYFYAYTPGRLLSVSLESQKFIRDFGDKDGGSDPLRFELGNLSIASQAGGLSLYWQVDEGSGNNVGDDSGNFNNGTLVNSPVWLSGINCRQVNCLSLDGNNDYIDIQYSSSLALNESFSVSLWVYLESDPNVDVNNNWRVLLRKQTGSTGPFYLYLEQSRTINLTLIKGGTSYRYIDNNFSAEQLTVGQWTHLAYTYDSTSGTATAYKNGSVSRSGLMRNGSGGPAIPPGPLDATTTGWRMSNNPGVYPPSSGAGSLPARINDFRLYSRALTNLEVQSLYNN